MLRSLLLISMIALCNTENINRTQTSTSQSSTWHNSGVNTSYTPDRAIDGNRDTCSHTENLCNSWWRIDLRGVYSISSVTIYNKKAKHVDLNGAQIHISYSLKDNGTANSTYRNISSFSIGSCNEYSFNAAGRYITVFSSDAKFIVVCEMNITATKKASPFTLVNENKTWVEALEHCRDKNMELASIINEETQAWAELEAMKATSSHVWLGLRYTCTLDFWFWISDHTVNFDRWDPNKTTNKCDESAAMRKTDYLWVPKPDEEKYNFICSKDKFW